MKAADHAAGRWATSIRTGVFHGWHIARSNDEMAAASARSDIRRKYGNNIMILK